VSGPLTRILSDLHYGDRASQVRDLAQLHPLFAGVSALVFNGDTLDTRPGPDPALTAQLRRDVTHLLSTIPAPVTLLTGNHDPDLSSLHSLELAAGQVFVTHGDVLFDDLVPWSNDAPEIRRLIHAAALPPTASLEDRLTVWRRTAVQIPQRHQSERNPVKYALHFAADTVWPPLRVFRILAAWRAAHPLAVDLARQHRPAARFILTGHTHRPGVHRSPAGVVSINTGSFCRPHGGTCVDLTPQALIVRRVEFRSGSFHPSSPVAEFSLAPA
jgi:predicted phosphodiesterase